MPQVITENQHEVFTEITESVAKISILHPAIRVNFIEILTILNYPYIDVWNLAVNSWQPVEIRRPFTSNMVTSVMKQLVRVLMNFTLPLYILSCGHGCGVVSL